MLDDRRREGAAAEVEVELALGDGERGVDAATDRLRDLAHERGLERVPLRRLIEPEEIAAAVLMLASPRASAVTGANLVVDGGLTSNLYILESFPPGARA